MVVIGGIGSIPGVIVGAIACLLSERVSSGTTRFECWRPNQLYV